jgi:hypothetical protein
MVKPFTDFSDYSLVNPSTIVAKNGLHNKPICRNSK